MENNRDKICITGASGYLGKFIAAEFRKKNYRIEEINRNFLYGSAAQLAEKISGATTIIHLAGAPIFQRWSEKNKKIILESRVKTTQNLVNAINALSANNQPVKVISASAIGIYKSGEIHDETSQNFDTGFLGKVVQGWESPLKELPEKVQLTIFRIGLVLGKEAKTIKNLLLPFQLGLGASVGKGTQPFPFVHENDVKRAFLWAVESVNKTGIYNLAAPEQITNKIFSKTMAKELHRPMFLFIPEILLKLVLGKVSVLLTESPIVISEKLNHSGFTFLYPTLQSAIREIISDKSSLSS